MLVVSPPLSPFSNAADASFRHFFLLAITSSRDRSNKNAFLFGSEACQHFFSSPFYCFGPCAFFLVVENGLRNIAICRYSLPLLNFSSVLNDFGVVLLRRVPKHVEILHRRRIHFKFRFRAQVLQRNLLLETFHKTVS